MPKRFFRTAAAASLMAALAQPYGHAQAPGAQTPAPQSPVFALATVIPLDPAVTTGTLPNGLRYIEIHNSVEACLLPQP